MKSCALSAMVMALAWGAEAMSSSTRGVRGKHHSSLLSDFHQHRDFIPDHDVGPMLKSAESMLMDLASRGGGTPLADLVAQIRPYILQMQDSIRAAYTSAQQILDNFASDFSGCATARSAGESEAASLENIKRGHSDNHKTCRTAEKTDCDKFSLCESQVTTLQGAKESSCQLYANAARAPGCDGIPPNPAETWKSYVLRAAIWFESERDSYLHKEAVCNNDTAKLEAKIQQCRGSDGSSGEKKECEDQKEECDATQLQLETATCSYVTKVDDTCESFAVCASNVADGYEAQLTGIQTMEQQRKVEWNATERLLCLLRAYGADGSVDQTKLQTCPNIADNTSHLTLTYPTGTGRPDACPDLLPHPCQADYISQEYGGLDAPAADCNPCAIAAPGPGPAPGPAQCESSATPPGSAGPRTSTGSSLTISGYDSRMLDSSGCIKTYDRSPGGTLSWGECMPGWPTTGIKALEGGQLTSPILLMESGEIYCRDNRFCHNANADGVGTVEYPDRTSDPAVQISVGSENLIILTQSGNVYTLGQARFDVVQRNVNGVGSSDTWIWEAKPVVGLPQDVVRVNMFHSYGAYGAIAVTQSGQIWGWGGRIARITAHKITPQGHNPAQMSWTPPDGSQWLDAKLGGYHALFGRTTTNKLYAMGEGGCTQFIGGSGGGPHEIVLPQVNGAEDPIKNYWSGYQVLFVLGESNKLYSVGGTEPGFCGENGVSAPTSCTASPNPVQLASLEGMIPVQMAGYYEAPNMALMDNGEIYMWGRFSAATPCPGRTNFNGGPTPVLVGAGSATVPLPACPLAGAPGAQSSPQSQAAAANHANGATGSSASTAGSSSQSSLPQDPGVEPPANYCDSGPGWMAGQCLLWAQKDENLDYVKYLLANGADVNAGPTAWPTWSPIFCALTYQTAISTEVVKLYIAYGADVNLIETDSGRTPVWAAESRGTAEQRQIMYDAGAVLCCGGNCEGVSAPNCADVTFP